MREVPLQELADRYLIERELGVGGMATVWLARDLRHDRLVALKVIRPELAGAIGIDRFLREVRLTARLQHPGIVPILDSGVLQPRDGPALPWYVMPYLSGESLRARLHREQHLPIEDALRITDAVGSALQAAHREGIVHRDIKPENIFLAGEHVYVVDFGIAKALVETGGERLTSTGLAIGTPAYMSPEQAAGDPVDSQTDQYSLATVLYEMLAGDVPFSAPTAQALLARRLSEPPRPIRSVRATVPARMEQVVLQALERVPADRHRDVAAFLEALRHQGPVVRSRRPSLRAVLGGAVAVAAIAASAMLVVPTADKPATRDSVAVALYQRGMQSLSLRTTEGAGDAMTSFRGALARDSTWGAAWAGLAQTYLQALGRRFLFSGTAEDSVMRLAISASDQARRFDGQNPEVLYTQGLVLRLLDPTDLGRSLRAFRQATAGDSARPRFWHSLGVTLYDIGERDEAIRAWHRAIAIDPTFSETLAFLALGFMWSRQYDSAAYWADSALAVDPAYVLSRQAHGNIEVERGNYLRAAADFEAVRRITTGVEIPNALAGSALVAARAGRRQEAARLLVEVESLMKGYTPAPLHNAAYNAAAYAALGEPGRAIQWLERFSPRESMHFQMHLRCDPALDPLANHPRFRALLVSPRPDPARGC